MNEGDPAVLPLDDLLRIDSACDRYEAAWKSGKRPNQVDYLSEFRGDSRRALLQHLAGIDCEYATVDIAEFRRRLTVEQLAPDEASGEGDESAKALSERMISEGRLTRYQAEVLLSQYPHPLLLDDYQILEEIGSGGMGTVYRAIHRRMNRTVAIKLVRVKANELERQGRWFRREVEVAGQLMHPNIVTAFDAGEARGVAYLVSEYVDGTDLRARISNKGAMNWREACALIRETARGLEHAHRSGIVHRDIKPSNIMLNREGLVRILDVGLARTLHTSTITRDSESNSIVGTPAFMAPEQFTAPAEVDARADIYSLGCTLYYLIAGRAIFDNSTALDWIAERPDVKAPSLRAACPDAPHALIALFQRTRERDPKNRPQSMAEVIAALDRILAPARSPWPWILSVFVLMLAAGFALWKPARKLEPVPPPIPGNTLPELAGIPFEPEQYQLAWASALGLPREIEPIPGLKARLIPPGKIQPPAESEIATQSIDAAFYLGTTEVTVKLFRQFVDSQSPKYVTIGDRHGGYSLGTNHNWRRIEGASWQQAGEQPITDDHPVCNLCRVDCADFCQWLSTVLAGRYHCRLPTETEWEWSCRAGSSARWSTGPNIADLNLAAWYTGTVESADARIRPVGRKAANGFGLFDMHGNLAEWCAGTFNLDHGVVRGGNILASGDDVASSARALKSLNDPVGGFRVLLIPVGNP